LSGARAKINTASILFPMLSHLVGCGTLNQTPSAVGYAKYRSRSHDGGIRVYDAAGNVIETHEHAGEFKEW
jgi:hypothetical protein